MINTFKAAFTAALLLASTSTYAADLNAADSAKLDAVLDARTDAQKMRDKHRHPKEILTMFGITPGMTVVDTLPGSWYGDILVPYLGAEGTYIGALYSDERIRMMSPDKPEVQNRRITGARAWPAKAAKYGGSDARPAIDSIRMLAVPESMNGTVDAWLFFRALHHINKFDTADLANAAQDAFRALKSGGVVGIVQHRANEERSAEFAKGFKGYIKQSRVVEAFTEAGFTLELQSEINANPNDKHGEDDFVWRMAPSNKSPEAQALGESDRMTLLFRKP